MITNPFQLTRAADLNDEQIIGLWVDPDGKIGRRLRPASQLPMVILGGRGSGKTHLMRYYSYHVQRLEVGGPNMRAHIEKVGYLGIHARCSGLNAARFSGKGFEPSQWQAVFRYYLELWLGQLLLQAVLEFLTDTGLLKTTDEAVLVGELFELFDVSPESRDRTLAGFSSHLKTLQRQLDVAINNAGFRRPLDPAISISAGRLIFGIPQTVAKHVPALGRTTFTLFIDEYEHFYTEAQQHFNTLIRERENPVTFKIGARLYGMRTYRTFSGDEELREGSDYELLNLDAALRENAPAYEAFATKLCASRIYFASGNALPSASTPSTIEDHLEGYFAPPMSPEDQIVKALAERDSEAPWIATLRRHLHDHSPSVLPLGVGSPKNIEEIAQTLRFAKNPLIEKTNTFLLYRAWNKRDNLILASREIASSAKHFDLDASLPTAHARVLDKFRDDLRAQMLHELDLQELGAWQLYVGLPAWIRMSDGIARNLITTLKHVFDWAFFQNESVYSNAGVSIRSQIKGTKDASQWFINDARVLGEDLGLVQTGTARVASLMRSLRFSEKPPECSLSTFSVDLQSVNPTARRVLDTSERWSLLIRTQDRKERNTAAFVVKYRINGMIAPEYTLPFYTRGSIHLSPSEADVIFGGGAEQEFGRLVRARLLRSCPPFSGSKGDPLSDELSLF